MTKQKKSQETRQALRQALIDLCSESEYNAVTVNQICRRAGVSRSTYYAYYDSIDSLLREIETLHAQEIRPMEPAILHSFKRDCTAEEYSAYLQELTGILRFYQSRRGLYVFLLSTSGDPYFPRTLKEQIALVYRSGLKRRQVNLGAREPYVIEFYASSYVTALQRWLIRQDKNCEQMATFLMKMTMLFSLNHLQAQQEG